MSLALDLSKLTHEAVVTLFVLDATNLGAPAVYRFVPDSRPQGQAIVWQGQSYAPFPIDAEGFEQRSDGPFPRPRLRCSNLFGTLGALVRQYNRLRGALLTRKRTTTKYLDAINFPDGNDLADPTVHYPDEVWTIDRTDGRNPLEIAWELASPLDVAGVMLPARQVLGNYCPWAYRGGDCGYTGGPVAELDDTPTTDPALDRCGKRLRSCQLRFGRAELPYGGFPGVSFFRQV